MPIYTVQAPDGKTYDIEGPEGATPEQLGAFITRDSAPKPYDVPDSVRSLMNVGQGVTFGFGDEIAGAFGADKGRYRATLEQFQQENPKTAMLGQVAGGLLIPGSIAKTLANPFAGAAAAGIGFGAIQGAGDAKTLEDVPNEASKSAIYGGAFAPLMLGTASGASSVARALGSRFSGDVANKLAQRRVLSAFERDGVTPDQVRSTMASLGGEARIADSAGESTRSLLNTNAYLPGKTNNTLEEVIRNRTATRPDRMDDVVYSVNDGMGRAKNLTEALTQQQLGVATPLYKKAHSLDIDPSPQLVRDLESAKKLGAFGEAEKIALASDSPFTLSASQQKLGQGRISVKDLDHIKRGIDSLIESQTDSVTGKVTTYGRELVGLKKRILGEVDSAVPEFAAARQAFAGPEALKTATNKGRSFWNEKADRLETIVADMTQSEQQAFRVGAAEQLREMVGGQTGQNRLLNFWKDRNTREKLQALLGDDVKYSQVEKLLKGEMTLKRLESLGPSRGSRTAEVLMGAEDQGMGIAADVANMGIQAKAGNWLAPLTGLKKYSAQLSSPEPVRDAIGNILLKQYATPEINALMEAQALIRRQQARAANRSGSVGGSLLDE